MKGAAAISATLVDVRNIAAHKCVRLEIHVPAEQAPLVMEAFGWPTMVDPVPVAIARLIEAKSNVAQIGPYAQRRRFETLKLAMQASLRCQDQAFWTYLNEDHGYHIGEEKEAAEAVREICNVDSRRQFDGDEKAAARWIELDSRYQVWRQVVV